MAQRLPPPWEWDKESPPPERKNEWMTWMTATRPPSTPTPWKRERHSVARGRMREDSEWERLVQVRTIYSLNLGFYSRVGWWFKNNIKEFQLMFGSYFRNLVFKSMNFLARGNRNSNFLNFFFSSVWNCEKSPFFSHNEKTTHPILLSIIRHLWHQLILSIWLLYHHLK